LTSQTHLISCLSSDLLVLMRRWRSEILSLSFVRPCSDSFSTCSS
jgi:hypothetical protein